MRPFAAAQGDKPGGKTPFAKVFQVG